MTMGSSSVAEKKISSAFIYFFGSFGGILFGYDIGVMTGALPFLQNDWGLAGNASISQAAVFAIFGCICLLGVAFIRNCVPETRGATLEEIEAAGIAHGKKDEACPATNMG